VTRPAATVAERPATLATVVARDDLAAALRWAVAGMTADAHRLPVLAGALLSAQGGALNVTTFDYEQSASMSVPAPGGSGEALVPSRLLTSMLHVAPRKSDVRLTVDGDRLVMQAGDDLEMSLPLLPRAEWPEPPTRGEPLFATTGERFAQLARGAVASGRDDSLPVLTGTLIESRDGKITAASTDRYRLSVATINGKFPARVNPVLVPSKVMKRLGSAFAKDRDVAVYLNRSASGPGWDHVTFASGSRWLDTRLLDGEFPKYRALMEHEVTCHLGVDREALRAAVRQAAVAVRSSPVVIHFDRKTIIEVSGGIHGHVSGEPHVKATVRGCKYDGEKMNVGINPDYLTGGLAAVGGERVDLALGSPLKPFTLRNPEDDGFAYLLMPVRLAE
jgi:DNA polymerase-3 subunit beta